MADILLVNGNPLTDISILAKPEPNLALIMKDGKIYRNQINWSARQEAEERIMEPVKSHRIKLRTLVVLQAVFAALALAFLFTSGWNAYTTGAPLSAAPVVPWIAMFLIYSAFLGHKAHRPASAAFRRATTDHGNQPLFLGSTSHA